MAGVPKSPSAYSATKSAPEAIAGRTKGVTARRNDRHVAESSERAASRYVLSKERNPARVVRYTYG